MNKEMEIIEEIIRKRYETDLVSPNLVSDVADRLNIKLSSEEIVYISDNFEKLI